MSPTIESPEAVGCGAERLARIRPVLQSFVDSGKFAGLSTLLARKGRIIHAEQVGWQDRESQTPLTSETIFRIYSMTKPIICTALMTLYEEGRFQLFHPLSTYLPAFGKIKVFTGTLANRRDVDPLQPITIR